VLGQLARRQQQQQGGSRVAREKLLAQHSSPAVRDGDWSCEGLGGDEAVQRNVSDHTRLWEEGDGAY